MTANHSAVTQPTQGDHRGWGHSVPGRLKVVKHSSVESMVQCKTDEDVIWVSKKFLLAMAIGCSRSKLTLHVGNGFELMKQNKDAFDIIITDSSDHRGSDENLFKESITGSWRQLSRTEYTLLPKQVPIAALNFIKDMLHFHRWLFSWWAMPTAPFPPYPSSRTGFMLCSKNPSILVASAAAETEAGRTDAAEI